MLLDVDRQLLREGVDVRNFFYGKESVTIELRGGTSIA
jgi:hypothetical protein